MKTSDLITDKEAAKILGKNIRYLTFQRSVHRGTKLPYQKINGHVFYHKEDVEKFRDMLNEKKKYSRKKVKCPQN